MVHIYNTQCPFMNFIYLSMNFPVMAHPYKWTILAKLRCNKSIHNNFSLITTHKGRHPCKCMEFLLAFLHNCPRWYSKFSLLLKYTPAEADPAFRLTGLYDLSEAPPWLGPKGKFCILGVLLLLNKTFRITNFQQNSRKRHLPKVLIVYHFLYRKG